MTAEWTHRSRELYEQAVFGGDHGAMAAADRHLDAVDAALCLARGRIAHARFLRDRQEDPAELTLFERAATLFHDLADEAGEAEATFWIGAYHQVVRGDHEAAEEPLRRAADLARRAGDRLTLSYVLRHQAFADAALGDPGPARRLMEESTRLRRELGFGPGVAANLVSLAYLAGEAGRLPDALGLLDEAESLAAAAHADGVQNWIKQAHDDIMNGDRRP